MSGGSSKALVGAVMVKPDSVSLMLGKGKANLDAKDALDDVAEAALEAEIAEDENVDSVVGDDRIEEPCADAMVGDHCYKALEWSKGVGINKHPDWYPNLTARASFREIQDCLWRRQKASCKRPCPEPATTPPSTMRVEDMVMDKFRRVISNERDRVPEHDAVSEASSEARADRASHAFGDVPTTDGAAQAPEIRELSTEQDIVAQEGDTASPAVPEDGVPRFDVPSEDAAQQADNASTPVAAEDTPSTGDAAQAPEALQKSTKQEGDMTIKVEVGDDVPTKGDAAQSLEAPQEGDVTVKKEASEGLPTMGDAGQEPEASEHRADLNDTAQGRDTASTLASFDLPSVVDAQQIDNASAPVAAEDAAAPDTSFHNADARSSTIRDMGAVEEPLPSGDDVGVKVFEGTRTSRIEEPLPVVGDQHGGTAALGAEQLEGTTAADADQDWGAPGTGAEQPEGTAVGAAGPSASTAGEELAGTRAPRAVVSEEPLPRVDNSALDEAGRAERARRVRGVVEAAEQVRRRLTAELRKSMGAQDPTTEESLEGMVERTEAEIKQRVLAEVEWIKAERNRAERQKEAEGQAEIMHHAWRMASAGTQDTWPSQ